MRGLIQAASKESLAERCEWHMLEDFLAQITEADRDKLCPALIDALFATGYGEWLSQFIPDNYPTEDELGRMYRDEQADDQYLHREWARAAI